MVWWSRVWKYWTWHLLILGTYSDVIGHSVNASWCRLLTKTSVSSSWFCCSINLTVQGNCKQGVFNERTHKQRVYPRATGVLGNNSESLTHPVKSAVIASTRPTVRWSCIMQSSRDVTFCWVIIPPPIPPPPCVTVLQSPRVIHWSLSQQLSLCVAPHSWPPEGIIRF